VEDETADVEIVNCDAEVECYEEEEGGVGTTG
jgi:hypothetical protein